MIALSKSMEVGVSKIDTQHKELIDRINAVSAMGLKAASREETQKTLDLLGAYIIKHFSDEEALQKQSNYSKYEWHKGQHASYIAEFNKLKNEFTANGHSPMFTLTMNNSIINWIVKHIKSADVELGKHLKSKGIF